MALALVKTIQMSFMFAFGIMTALDLKLHQAYGRSIKTIGIFLVLTAVYGSFNMYVGLKGSMNHNKFLLLLHAILDFIGFLIQMMLGLELLWVTYPGKRFLLSSL